MKSSLISAVALTAGLLSCSSGSKSTESPKSESAIKVQALDKSFGISFSNQPVLSQLSGKCIGVDSIEAGQLIRQQDCDGAASQAFDLVSARDGESYALQLADTNLCVDVYNSSGDDGAVVGLWDCHGGRNQTFTLDPQMFGDHRLAFKHSQKCLEVRDSSLDSGATLTQSSCSPSVGQTFGLSDIGPEPRQLEIVILSAGETVDQEGKDPNAFAPAIVSMSVQNRVGQSPEKGNAIIMEMQLVNNGGSTGRFNFAPKLTADGFEDYQNIAIGGGEIELSPYAVVTVRISLPLYFSDISNGKQYALNKGNYSAVVDLQVVGGDNIRFENFAGSAFSIAASKAVLTAVFWDQPYFDKVRYAGGVQQWMKDTFKRKSAVANANNEFSRVLEGGFDEMMDVRTSFADFQGFRLDTGADMSGPGIVLQLETHAGHQLGLQRHWQSNFGGFTHNANHGFDMAIGLSENGFGGLAYVGGNSQVSGIFDSDTSVGRSQMVLIHETGHNFGAPHCDPVSGFVMCSGEKNAQYPIDGTFVWLDESVNVMNKARLSKKV